METHKIIRKLIREAVDKLFELQRFQGEEAEQLSMSTAMHTLPRKGLDDSINNWNQVEAQRDGMKTGEELEDEWDSNSNTPSPAYMAPTSTNLYEGLNSDAANASKNLDFDRGTRPPGGGIGADAQAVVDEFNDNINRELDDVKYPGVTSGMFPPTNTTSTPVA